MPNPWNLLLTWLSGLSPFAKAVVPAAGSLVAAIVSALVTGNVDQHALTIALTGLVGALVTYLVPNKPAPTPSTTARLTARSLTPRLLRMADGLSASVLPSGWDAYAGYVGGFWPSWASIVQRFKSLFKQGRIVSIAVNASETARILDCENGDAIPEECGPWLRRMLAAGVEKPGIYASLSAMPAVMASIQAAGIDRALIVLWVAHWDGIFDVPAGYEAKQIMDHGPNGENIDVNAALESFFPSQPGPVHKNDTHYLWFDQDDRPDLGGSLHTNFRREVSLVRRYDELRKHGVRNRRKLRAVRHDLVVFADRVYEVASEKGSDGKPNWRVDHLGWRRQQLIHRAQGQRFV